MTKAEKLLQKAIQCPHKVSFKEMETILKQFGFERVKTNAGSHMKWVNKKMKITFRAPRKNPMNRIYIKDLIQTLDNYFKKNRL